MPKIDVYKFGGVAVGSAEAIRVAAAHVKRAAPGVAVVVSAMNGVTDLLLAAANAALAGDRESIERAARDFEQRHVDVVKELLHACKRHWTNGKPAWIFLVKKRTRDVASELYEALSS